MMDALAIEAAEAAVACAYPAGAGAVLIVELDGPARRGRARSSRGCGEICRDAARSSCGWRPTTGRAGGDLEGPQVGVRRRRADQPRLHRAGRRGAAHRAAARCWPSIDAAVGRVRHPGGQRLPRRRRQPAPAGAVRRRGAGRGRAGRGGLGRDPRPVHRARRLDHRRARRGRGQGEVHAEDVHRRRTSTPCSWCAAPSTPGACPTRARSSPRRGCAARCPGVRKGVHPLVESGQAEQF